MKIVLIDGVDTYQVSGHTLHLGQTTEVEDQLAGHLLSQRTPEGSPMFVVAGEFVRRPVRLRLTDRAMTYRSATIYAEGLRPVEVPEAIAPFLLRKRRHDNAPLFELTTL